MTNQPPGWFILANIGLIWFVLTLTMVYHSNSGGIFFAIVGVLNMHHAYRAWKGEK